MRVRVTTPILGAISKQSHIASDTCARAWQAASLGCAVFAGNFTPPDGEIQENLVRRNR